MGEEIGSFWEEERAYEEVLPNVEYEGTSAQLSISRLTVCCVYAEKFAFKQLPSANEAEISYSTVDSNCDKFRSVTAYGSLLISKSQLLTEKATRPAPNIFKNLFFISSEIYQFRMLISN